MSASDNYVFSVEGYKAVRNRQNLRIAPLTIISGVNSSGKSSFMQPFLLMKQTLDSPSDPGPLLLYGANVKVTEYAQMFSRGKAKNDVARDFSVKMSRGDSWRQVKFGIGAGEIDILSDISGSPQGTLELTPKPTAKQRATLLEKAQKEVGNLFSNRKGGLGIADPQVFRNRCFLGASIGVEVDKGRLVRLNLDLSDTRDRRWVDFLRDIIHVPGLRGNPERSYQRSAVGESYPGTIETYVASIIFQWASEDPDKLAALAADLEYLGLTWKVVARRVNDASVELLVGRMPHAQQGGAHDLVSVADVGFGVSQTLPVLVALHAARPGQVVYIEQPEIHLHPRAQLALADVLVEAAQRGVLVVAETHSSLLIRGIQIATAKGLLAPDDLSFNWFNRDSEGAQQITVAQIDDKGRFGDWPLDFDDISRDADWQYLDAVEV